MDLKGLFQQLPKEILVILLVTTTGIIIWFVHQSIAQVKKQINDRNNSLDNQFNKINETLEKLDKKIDSLDEKLDKNSIGTKANLYYSIDQLLTQVELFGVWSSQLKETYQKMCDSYIELGNGLDKGKTFEARADKIEVDDTKFHDVISNYNKNRRKLFLEHLEHMEQMF